MKQLVILALLMLMGLGPSVFAQAQRATNLGDITLRFCNDTTTKEGSKAAVLETEPEEPLEICMYINNSGPTDATIGLNFVDGTITADVDQKKACEPENTKTNFGQYVTDYPTTVQIQAGETVKIAATATFPAGYAGTSYGCATFQMTNGSGAYEGGEQTQMFTILSRRANFVDIDVKGEYIVDLQVKDATTDGSFSAFSSSDVSVVDSLLTPWHNIGEVISTRNPLALKLGKSLTTRSVLMNSGNVGLDLTVDAHYRGLFGLLDYHLGSQSQKLVPKQQKIIEFATPDWAWWLGGPTTVTHMITYKPIIIGSGGSIAPELLNPQTKVLTSTGLVTARRGWQMLGAAAAIVLGYLLYLINRILRRNSNKPSRKTSKKSFN